MSSEKYHGCTILHLMVAICVISVLLAVGVTDLIKTIFGS